LKLPPSFRNKDKVEKFIVYSFGNIAHRKHIIADRIRFIGKESNNLDEASVFGIDDDLYLEYENIEDFKQWILSLRPKDVKDKGISERGVVSRILCK